MKGDEEDEQLEEIDNLIETMRKAGSLVGASQVKQEVDVNQINIEMVEQGSMKTEDTKKAGGIVADKKKDRKNVCCAGCLVF